MSEGELCILIIIRTGSCANVGCNGKECVVGIGRLGRPDVGKSTLDEDQAWPAE